MRNLFLLAQIADRSSCLERLPNIGTITTSITMRMAGAANDGTACITTSHYIISITQPRLRGGVGGSAETSLWNSYSLFLSSHPIQGYSINAFLQKVFPKEAILQEVL